LYDVIIRVASALLVAASRARSPFRIILSSYSHLVDTWAEQTLIAATSTATFVQNPAVLRQEHSEPREHVTTIEGEIQTTWLPDTNFSNIQIWKGYNVGLHTCVHRVPRHSPREIRSGSRGVRWVRTNPLYGDSFDLLVLCYSQQCSTLSAGVPVQFGYCIISSVQFNSTCIH